MDKNIEVTILYDYYKELLTEKQRYLFESYYFENLSLSEISENEDISRNAVHKTIKTIEEKLLDYEKKLHIKEKIEALESLSIDNNIKQEILTILKK